MDARKCEVLSTAAAAVMPTVILAVKNSRTSAGLARCWRGYGGADGTLKNC